VASSGAARETAAEPIDFTALSAIMYYDLGLVAEW
jgi:hypothetical protein